MRTSTLRDLARRFSIETSYTDAAGARQQASKAALVAAIEKRSGMSVDDAAKTVAEPRTVEPVTVVWGHAKPRVALHGCTRAEWDLALEDGSWRSGRADVVDGVLTLPDALPYGYHTLTINNAHETLLIAAPMKAHAPREKTWGVFAPLYAAHSRRSWGAGDLGDLLAYASWIDDYNGGVVATLPMLAAFDDEPSPYSPVSRLYWNELYLDVTRLPELQPDDLDHGAIAHLQQTPRVDYAAVRREKRRVLERCAARFARNADFERFAARANDYAQFRARIEQRDSAAYHLYVQYRMAQQMREVANAARRLGAGLYLDFPLGVNPGGYDAHEYAHVFANGVAVGAPPDLFFTKGQNWGFAPFDPDAVREDRYRYFRAAVRQHVSHAGILRIDHVMGLHRLYWIPDGGDARDGVYVRYRADELYAILTLESQRHGCVVVGEDLGTVPPEVPKMMSRHGLRQMYVVQYEVKPDAPLPAPPAASVASINTHDMPPFAAWWNGKDVDDRVEMGLLDEVGAQREHAAREQMRRAIVREFVDGPTESAPRALEVLLAFLASSDAEIVLVNLEDLWGERESQNVPGVPERSWTQKFRLGLEQMRADGSIRRVLTNVSARRARALLENQHEQGVKEG
ncbi:MAG: 4-alpha-glucanotransferase [Acidobacteria bacterium]|nr:4-alpha-glucanotransferase [Acidobacteriota bacterium]MBV9477174.1 4-alpha-glucanotransferase [Acidobacteriota bacterium]